MTFLDTSVIIDYLQGIDSVVSFVDAQDSLLTSTVCVYEVLEGEVFAPGPTDVFGRRQDFGRVQTVDLTEQVVIEAAALQDDLRADGDPLSARDVMIAATARSTGDELVVADTDFETRVLTDVMDVTDLRA